MNHTNGKCPSESLKILGDFWTLQIIEALSFGCKRFSELQRTLEKNNPVTLTSRLKLLEKEGFIARAEETVDKLSVVYTLSDKGKGVLPILDQIRIFSQQDWK